MNATPADTHDQSERPAVPARGIARLSCAEAALALGDHVLPEGALAEPGLYLFFPDAPAIELTREKITRLAARLWQDPAAIPPAVREATDFRRCDICPLLGKGGICDALRPSLPFVEDVDRYMSFDQVLAVYREKDSDILYVSRTTMQNALKYVSVLSLMFFCQNGRQYWKYFRGIVPLSDIKDIAVRLYLNIFWLHRANPAEVGEVIRRFNNEILMTTENQVKRMCLICKNDAFLNTFVGTQYATAYLALDMPNTLQQEFDAFDRT